MFRESEAQHTPAALRSAAPKSLPPLFPTDSSQRSQLLPAKLLATALFPCTGAQQKALCMPDLYLMCSHHVACSLFRLSTFPYCVLIIAAIISGNGLHRFVY